MKRILYILLCTALLPGIFTEAYGQQAIFEGGIPVKIQRLRQVEDSVQLIADFDLKNLSLNTQRYLTLTPKLVDGKGHELKLKNVLINGKTRHKAFLREVQLNGWEKQVRDAHYDVIPFTKENRKVYRYRQAVAYENWMRDAWLEVETGLCGCAGFDEVYASYKITDRIVLEGARRYRSTLGVAFISPEVEQVKARDETGNVFLDFPVAHTEIIPTFGNNPRELAKIEQIIAGIRSDKNLTVTGVTITGYASPEGEGYANIGFANGRAEALRGYLSMRAGIPSNLYRVGSGGEDWPGLAHLVQQSYIEPKGTILHIINSYPPEERKTRLKALNGGQPYRQMLNTLYPRLRRVEARIQFTVRNFNINEAREVIRKHPGQLSLNEMFLLANTYPEGSKEFIDVFNTAVSVFPNDPVANLNAAGSALMAGDLEEAGRFLQKAQRNTPEYYNNLGVLEMMRGNTERAKSLFKRASESKLDAAIKNLAEAGKKEEAEKSLRH